MKIRFGYVSHAISLWEASPAKTVTYTNYEKMSKDERHEKLLTITATNLRNTLRMLYFNVANEIELYRFSSSIVPLATHPEVRWDFYTPFKDKWREIGDTVKKHNLRVSFHPNQFTLFTSPKETITKNAVIDMEYHYNMLEAMGLADEGFINIHVGGAYGDKVVTMERFYKNLKQLPLHIKARMTLENDDKTYDTAETLDVCQKERIPMMFDYHHHKANECETLLTTILPEIFKTWEHTGYNPKVHISSPKTAAAFRSHADYVDADFMLPFMDIARELNQDFDVMIEAKAKEQALLKLVDDLSKIRGVKRTSGASLEWK